MTKIYLNETIIPSRLLDENKESIKMYSVMHPEPSDHFNELNEVIEWLNTLKMSDRLKYIENNTIMIYSHVVACREIETDHNYTISKGEVISTDEAYSIHWTGKKWVPWNELPGYIDPFTDTEIIDIKL